MAEKTTKQVDVKVSAPGAEQAKRQLSGLGQTLKDLNNAGKMSGLTGDSGIIGFLKGAGVAAAIKFAADGVRDMARAWGEYKAGALSAADATRQVAAAIPLVGSVFEATFALMDAVSGRAAQKAQIARQVAEFDKNFQKEEGRTRSLEQMRGFAAGINQPDLAPKALAELVKNRRAIDIELAKVAAKEADDAKLAAIHKQFPGMSSDPRLQGVLARAAGVDPSTPTMTSERRAALRELDQQNAAAIAKLQREALRGVGNLGAALKDGLAGSAAKVSEALAAGIGDANEQAAIERGRKLMADIFNSISVKLPGLKTTLRERYLEYMRKQTPGYMDRDTNIGVLNRSAASIDSRFLSGHIPTGTQDPQKPVVDKLAESNLKLEAVKDGIKNMASEFARFAAKFGNVGVG